MKKFILRHWYDIGLVVAIITLIWLIINWSDMIVLRKLVTVNFIAILCHQFEEYGRPGGEGAIMNIALGPPANKNANRFPLNQLSAFASNVPIAYILYLFPIFFTNQIWLALPGVFMEIPQLVIHGVVTNKKMKSFYNPGLFAVIVLHLPVDVYYIYYVISRDLTHWWDWIIGAALTVFIMGVVLNQITHKILVDPNSKYPFDENEMARFHVKERLLKKGINPDVIPEGMSAGGPPKGRPPKH